MVRLLLKELNRASTEWLHVSPRTVLYIHVYRTAPRPGTKKVKGSKSTDHMVRKTRLKTHSRQRGCPAALLLCPRR